MFGNKNGKPNASGKNNTRENIADIADIAQLSLNDNGIKLIDKLIDSINSKRSKRSNKSKQPKELINLVGYIDDPLCDKHYLIQPDHQESYKRTKVIRWSFNEYKLNELMEHIPLISVQLSDLTKVHSKEYIDILFAHGKANRPVVIPSPSTEVSMQDCGSIDAMLAAVFGTISAIDVVTGDHEYENKEEYASNKIRKVFCNIRPPGHHAHYYKGAGFCFLNNVAIGAQYAMDKYPELIKKVLIFDWDLHHGDGTENIFYTNPNVMYVSFHRGGMNREDAFYPGTGTSSRSSGTKHINKTGNIVNFPISLSESKNSDSYMNKFNNEFMPKAYEFKPDLVMISAGFDSHKDDLYHALPLDYSHYHVMTQKLAILADTCANGRLVSVLEGGYTLNVLYKCAIVHVATLIDGSKISDAIMN
jgi:acetoin utilization deacetylase AcuC-like enzyme